MNKIVWALVSYNTYSTLYKTLIVKTICLKTHWWCTLSACWRAYKGRIWM